MAAKVPSFSCVATALSSPYKPRRVSQLSFSEKPFLRLDYDPQTLKNAKGRFLGCVLNLNRTRTKQNSVFATSEDELRFSEVESDSWEPEEDQISTLESLSYANISSCQSLGNDGKPGLISFYSRPYKPKDEISKSNVPKKQSSLLWLMGPAVLVASFIFPSLYLRRIFSTIFEDSLLTDFLILFFTEALFYCGVAVFLLLMDRIRRPMELESLANDEKTRAPQLGQRISSVASLVLSLIIPLVTMGLVWPWTGPAASATLAPFLVGIVVQFAFEQYAKLRKSPSWPVIPIIFQVYRLHQLNRAAQLVTALSFTVRGAEMTSHNLEISSSLSTLLNVLQFLGLICIWSLSSFLMKFYPPTAGTSD